MKLFDCFMYNNEDLLLDIKVANSFKICTQIYNSRVTL